MADGDGGGVLVQRPAHGTRSQGFRVRAELPQRPLRVPRVLEGHLEAQPAVRVGLLGADGQRRARQFIPPRPQHPYHHDELGAAGPEPSTAFPPHPLQVRPGRPLGRFGRRLGGNLVRLNVYTTDVDLLLPHYGVLAARLAAAGVAPVTTMLGESRLVIPGQLVELEGTAVG